MAGCLVCYLRCPRIATFSRRTTRLPDASSYPQALLNSDDFASWERQCLGARYRRGSDNMSRPLVLRPTRRNQFRRRRTGTDPLRLTSQPAAASLDGSGSADVRVPTDLALISTDFVFLSHLVFRT